MTAKQLMLPTNRAFDSNGRASAFAVARLYTTETLTPQLFYADAEMATSLGSSITANASGKFPMAYQDSATPFRIIIEDATGAQLDDIDPFYFCVGPTEADPTVDTSPILLVIAGQSNATGSRTGGPNPASALVKTWDSGTDAWGGSDYTQQPWLSTAPRGNGGNNNIGLAAAHYLADTTGRPVYVIMNAIGGHSINDWILTETFAGTGALTTFPQAIVATTTAVSSVEVDGVTKTLTTDYTLVGTIVTFTVAPASGAVVVINYAAPRYTDLQARVTAALATTELTGKTAIDFLIWSQGEADFEDEFNVHLTQLGTLHDQLITESWFPEYTRVFVTGSANLHDRYEFEKANRYYPEAVNQNWSWVPADGLLTEYESTGTGDVSHFLGAALWEFGYGRIGPMFLRGWTPSFRENTLIYGRGNGLMSPGDTLGIFIGRSIVSYGSTDPTAPTAPTTTFISSDSMTWGSNCQALGAASQAFGDNNISASPYEMSLGRYAKYTTAQTDRVRLQVGVGGSEPTRQNGLTVRQSGTVEILAPSSAGDPTQSEEVVLQRVTNTSLKIKMMGTDGTVRSVTLTLA